MSYLLEGKMTRIFRVAVAVLICLLMVTTLMPTEAYGQMETKYDDYAEKLSRINVFVGTGSGFELDRKPTRLEGLIMLIRLLGVEEEAVSMAGQECIFGDVPEWGRGYVNYGYENGLTNGVSDTEFGSESEIQAKSYVTFLLRALGYDDKAGDFSWNESLEFARGISLLEEGLYTDITSGDFYRDHVARCSYDTLNQMVKDGSDTLGGRLVKMDAIEEGIALEIGVLFNGDGSAEVDEPSIEADGVDFESILNAVVQINVYDEDDEMMGTASGFYVSEEGRIVTNYHVIDGVVSLEIVEHDGDTYFCQDVLEYDIYKDIAILQGENTDYYMNEGEYSDLSVGDSIFAVGSPYGLHNTLSEGIVSAMREDFLQISSPISAGSSGGVVINTDGEAVAIVFAAITDGENLGFAIPINEMHDLEYTDSIKLKDMVFQPFNVTVTDIGPDTAYVMWDEAYDVDYYYMFFAESDDEELLTYIDEDGNPEKYYYDGYYKTLWGLEPDTDYVLVVTSVRDGVESEISDYLEFKTLEAFAPDDFDGEAVGNNEVVLEWDQVTDAVFYRIYMELEDGSLQLLYNIDENSWVFTRDPDGTVVYGLTEDTDYTFYVTAIVDGIESELSEDFQVTTLDKKKPMVVYSSDGQYLGELSSNKYSTDSIFNEGGDYGSEESDTSIWNENCVYGDSASDFSAFNEDAENPPLIYSSEGYYGRLTVNDDIEDGISPVVIYHMIRGMGY